MRKGDDEFELSKWSVLPQRTRSHASQRDGTRTFRATLAERGEPSPNAALAPDRLVSCPARIDVRVLPLRLLDHGDLLADCCGVISRGAPSVSDRWSIA